GTDESTYQFCFPEGTSCPFFARLRGYDAAGLIVADSRDVLIADSFSNGKGPIATPISISDCAARIRSADIVVGNEILNPDRHPGRVQIDHLSFTVPSQPCNPHPNPPSILIIRPSNNTKYDEYGQVPVYGLVTAPGGVSSFCVGANESAPPPPAQCLQANAVAPDGTFGPLYVDVSRFVEGTNTIAVHV